MSRPLAEKKRERKNLRAERHHTKRRGRKEGEYQPERRERKKREHHNITMSRPPTPVDRKAHGRRKR
jgi:hypothetical protein